MESIKSQPGFASWYLIALRKAFKSSGRSRRREFWSFYGTNLGLWLGFGIVGLMVSPETPSNENPWGVAGGVFLLVVAIPMITAQIRRLQDTGRTGAWILLNFVPLFGWLALAVMYSQDGTSGANRYGPDPKAA